jgi:hypothetical protein
MKVVLIVAVVAAVAVLAAGWKWHGHNVGHAQGQYKIAGWSWGDGAGQGNDATPGGKHHH